MIFAYDHGAQELVIDNGSGGKFSGRFSLSVIRAAGFKVDERELARGLPRFDKPRILSFP